MAVEPVIRLRCDTCALALEVPHPPFLMPKMPWTIPFGLKAMPEGWAADPDGKIHCPAHPMRMVDVVHSLPHAVDNGRH